MFLVAAKTTVVIGLREVFDAEFQAQADSRPFPRKIDIEWPNEAEDWPCIVVDLRVSNVSWTGINPDEYYLDPNPIDPSVPFRRYRHGVFDGFLDLSVEALTSEERDRMWDTLVNLFLMGRTRDVTKDFFDRMETGTLVGLTVAEGAIEPLGDNVVMGTPWSDEVLSYEAGMRVALTGEFYADAYNGNLVPLSSVEVHDSMEGAEPLYDAAGLEWQPQPYEYKNPSYPGRRYGVGVDVTTDVSPT